MATTHQGSRRKESFQNKKVSSHLSQVGKTEIALNQAYDCLNSCAAKNTKVGPELAEIFPEVIDIGKRIYLEAIEEYENGNLNSSLKLSVVVTELSDLLEGLTEQSMDNILALPAPPRLKSEKKKTPKLKSKLHPSLKLFASMIESKIKKSSKMYGDHLIHYPQVLAEVSKCLRKMEEIH